MLPFHWPMSTAAVNESFGTPPPPPPEAHTQTHTDIVGPLLICPNSLHKKYKTHLHWQPKTNINSGSILEKDVTKECKVHPSLPPSNKKKNPKKTTKRRIALTSTILQLERNYQSNQLDKLNNVHIISCVGNSTFQSSTQQNQLIKIPKMPPRKLSHLGVQTQAKPELFIHLDKENWQKS